MTARTAFPGLKALGDTLDRISLVVNQILLGKLNCTLSVTLTASATTTTVTDPRINATSVFVFDPRTVNARSALFSMYVSAVSKGSATITHTSTATTDRTFICAILA